MIFQLGCDILVGYSKCVFDPNFSIVDLLFSICIVVCIVSLFFVQKYRFLPAW